MSEATNFVNKVVSISNAVAKMGLSGMKVPKDILPVFDSIEILVLRFYKDSHKLNGADNKMIDDKIKLLTTTMTSLFANAFETAILMSIPKENK